VPLGPAGLGPHTFVSTSLALPLLSSGQPVRLSLRASAAVPGTLVVYLGGARVGSDIVSSGTLGWHELDVPSPRRGRRLDLALSFWPQPVSPDSPTTAVLTVERLEVTAQGGLSLVPSVCLLAAACVPAAFIFLGLLRLAPGRALAASAVAAVVAALTAHAAPIQLVHVGPHLLVATMAVVVAVRLPISAARDKHIAGRGAWAWTWAAGLAALPAIEISLLLAAFFRRTLFDHVPAIVNDAVDYWLEARAFAVAGFHGGYFTIDERPARAAFLHFGSHGPFFPMLHGSLGRLFGWHPWSIPVFHLVMVTAALLVFARCVPAGRGRVLTALSLITFWPLLLLLPTSLQEGWHLAVALLLAAALRPVLDGESPPALPRAGLVALLGAAGLVRPSWGLLLPPVFAMLWGPSWRRRALAATAGVATWVLLVAAFAYTKAPFGREEFLFLRTSRMQIGVPAVFAHVAMNAHHFVESGSGLEVRSRFLVLALALASGVLAARGRPRRELSFHAWNLGSIMVAALLTYIFGPWADYRVFAAHLLLTQVLLATSRVAAARRLALLALLAQVASAGPFAEAFNRLDESYRYDAARIEAFGAAARQGVSFDASRDAWCNTLVSVNPPYVYPEMVELPAGVGVTIFFGWQGAPQRELRSLYVLLDPDDPQRWTVGAPKVTLVGPDQVRITAGRWLSMNLKPIAATPVGTLYRNLDARCAGG
jgi:hypothetical protein